jgi:hypothetical protein
MALDIFAPRHPRELGRTLRDDGALLVFTHASSHLAELRNWLGLPDIDRRTEKRIFSIIRGLSKAERKRVQETQPAALKHF